MLAKKQAVITILGRLVFYAVVLIAAVVMTPALLGLLFLLVIGLASMGEVITLPIDN